jgi:hypothetical protein
MQRPASFVRTTGISLVLAASLAAGAEAAPQRWAKIRTTAGFSLDQPVGWQMLAGPSDSLHIISGPCRAEAVIICAGESQIVVTSEPAQRRSPLKVKSCWSLVETKTEDGYSPGNPRSVESVDHLTCTIGDRQFSILESHWKGDKRAASYGRIAIRMAKSLRYPG